MTGFGRAGVRVTEGCAGGSQARWEVVVAGVRCGMDGVARRDSRQACASAGRRACGHFMAGVGTARGRAGLGGIRGRGRATRHGRRQAAGFVER
jgi:hypothetical protein